MVDQTIPTTQFHEYQKPDVEPHSSQQPTSGLSDILNKVGLGSLTVAGITEAIRKTNLGDSLKNVDVKGSVNKARDYARANPGKVLGGLAALVIGAGLMRQRSMRK